ncbi:MAG: 5-formyltetrahydrofolate cyclo-ligase [Methylobacterium frigidaeris]
MSDSPADKAALRRLALARRDALPPEARAVASGQVADLLFALPELARHGLVSAYWPIRSELDLRPLLQRLRARGQAVALPQVTPNGLVFRLVGEGEHLARGGFGLSEPGPDAPVVRPRALLVPLAAFDRRGHRIGYGKGYFDRALADLDRDGPLDAIGVAFAAQEVERVPDQPYDRRLGRIVTEAGLIDTGA